MAAPGEITGYALNSWAGDMIERFGLDAREAAVLRALVEKADRRGVVRMPIRVIAKRSGYKPTPRKDRSGKVTWKCTAVSSALRRLQELQIVWSSQGGRGGWARRELLWWEGCRNGEIRDLPPTTEDGQIALLLPALEGPATPAGGGVNSAFNSASTENGRAGNHRSGGKRTSDIGCSPLARAASPTPRNGESKPPRRREPRQIGLILRELAESAA